MRRAAVIGIVTARPTSAALAARTPKSGWREVIGILDRYLLKEVSKTLAALMGVLMLVVFATSFIRYLSKVAAGDIGASVILQLVGVEMLRNLSVLVPPAFFFAVLYTLGRMHRDSELVALESCGVGPWRIFRSVLFASVPVVALVGWLAVQVLPWGNQMIQRIKSFGEGAAAELAMIDAGRFNEYSRGDLVFYVESLDPKSKTMSRIFVQNRQHGRIGLLTAATGYEHQDPTTGDSYLVLVDGRRYEGVVGERDYRIARFDEYALRIGRADEGPRTWHRKEKPTLELAASPDVKDRAEAQYRLTQPVVVLGFALLSIPLSRSRLRSGIYGRMAFAFLVYFIFLNLLGVSQNLMRDEITPQWMGMWWVPLLMCLVALILLMLEARSGRVLLRRLRGALRR